MQIRQGDVLLTPVDLPSGSKRVESNGPVVLALGEATGHSHTVDGVEEFTLGSRRFILIDTPAVVRHQEHAPLVLQPGTYEVVQQVEHWYEEARQVRD